MLSKRRSSRLVLVVTLAAAAGLPAREALAASPEDDTDEVSAGTGEERVPRLLEALRGSGSFKARATAAVALGRLGDPRAAPALADALRSDDHYAVRVAAASALGRLPTADAIQPLLGALHDQDPFVREEASSSLARFHTAENVFAFREGLQADDPVVRLAAVRAYGDVLRKTPGVSPLVVEALGDDDDDVRRAAEQAIAGIPHERAVPLLVGSLTSGGSQVRAACARLLEKRTDKTAVEPLVLLMTAVEEGEETRRAARDALKAHASYIDVEARLASANDLAAGARDGRLQALRVLAALAHPSAPALVERDLADADPAVRVAAARAAGDLGDRGKKLLEAAVAREADPRTRKQLELILRGLP